MGGSVDGNSSGGRKAQPTGVVGHWGTILHDIRKLAFNRRVSMIPSIALVEVMWDN